MRIQDAIQEARSIPRAARVAQGYPQVRAFADHLRQIRAERATARKYTDSLASARASICARLRAELRGRADLKLAARRESGLGCEWTPPCDVRWGCEPTHVAGPRYVKYHWRNGPAGGTVYRCSGRYIVISAAHALAMLRGRTSWDY